MGESESMQKGTHYILRLEEQRQGAVLVELWGTKQSKVLVLVDLLFWEGT